jgi:hypothetical protein
MYGFEYSTQPGFMLLQPPFDEEEEVGLGAMSRALRRLCHMDQISKVLYALQHSTVHLINHLNGNVTFCGWYTGAPEATM